MKLYHPDVSRDKTGFQNTANCDSCDFELFLKSQKEDSIQL